MEETIPISIINRQVLFAERPFIENDTNYNFMSCNSINCSSFTKLSRHAVTVQANTKRKREEIALGITAEGSSSFIWHGVRVE